MGKTIDAFVDADLRDAVKIMVGGAPVTPEFAQDMGADGYSADASSAVEEGEGADRAAAREGARMSSVRSTDGRLLLHAPAASGYRARS